MSEQYGRCGICGTALPSPTVAAHQCGGIVTYPTKLAPSIGMDFGATVAPNVEQITAAAIDAERQLAEAIQTDEQRMAATVAAFNQGLPEAIARGLVPPDAQPISEPAVEQRDEEAFSGLLADAEDCAYEWASAAQSCGHSLAGYQERRAEDNAKAAFKQALARIRTAYIRGVKEK